MAQNFVYRPPVAVAWSSSGSVALHYVLPVLWMTSRLVVVGRMIMYGLSVVKYSAPSGIARPGWSMLSMNALFFVVWMDGAVSCGPVPVFGIWTYTDLFLSNKSLLLDGETAAC